MLSIVKQGLSKWKQEHNKRIAIINLLTQTQQDTSYYIFLTVSTIITTLGIQTSNIPIIIGGMLLAPIITPIITLGMGVATLSFKSMLKSLSMVIRSSALVIIIANITDVLLITITTYPHNTGTILKESAILNILTTPPFIYFTVALLSGIGATFAWIKNKEANTLPGVSIAVTLVPPLSTVGIGISRGHILLTMRALTVFAVNILGIFIGAFAVFIVFGTYHFKNLKYFEEHQLKNMEEI